VREHQLPEADLSVTGQGSLMTVEVEARDGRTVIRPVGELDMDTVEHLERPIRQAICDGTSVEVDLSGLSFFASSGLRLLLVISDHAAEASCKLSLTHPSPQVARIIELTGTSDLISPDGARPG
jgi:anti-anti-sigma factor